MYCKHTLHFLFSLLPSRLLFFLRRSEKQIYSARSQHSEAGKDSPSPAALFEAASVSQDELRSLPPLLLQQPPAEAVQQHSRDSLRREGNKSVQKGKEGRERKKEKRERREGRKEKRTVTSPAGMTFLLLKYLTPIITNKKAETAVDNRESAFAREFLLSRKAAFAVKA